MQSHITIQAMPVLVKLLSADQVASLSTILLNCPIAKFYTLQHGQAITQSISHYLAHLELFECHFTKDSTFNILVNKASFFMFVMLKGHSLFTDFQGNIVSETRGNCCTLSHIKAGNYRRKFSAGSHTMLLLTFREHYFKRKCKALPQFAELLNAGKRTAEQFLVLPHCAVAEQIFKLLKKSLAKKSPHHKTDVAFHAFLEECLDKYHNALLAKHYDTNTVHKIKTAEIEQFVKENYTEKFADDLRKLANRFNLSQRTAARLIRKEFGMSLHEYIVKLRMDRALSELTGSNRAIKDIAAQVGYSDPLYFSKVFKKYYKIAPSDVKRI